MSEDDRQKYAGRRRGRRIDPREEQRASDPGLEPSSSGVVPRVAIGSPNVQRVPQREWELALKDRLTWLDESQRREIFAAIARQEIARAHSVLLNERERQPKNITVQRAYEAFRKLAIQDLESVLGGLQLVPRKRPEASNVAATGQLRALLAHVDGHTPYEGLIRGSGLDRLRAIELLVELIEHRLIGVDPKEPMRALPPRDDRATMPDPEEVANQMALMRGMPTPSATPAVKAELARVPSPQSVLVDSESEVPTVERPAEVEPVAPLEPGREPAVAAAAPPVVAVAAPPRQEPTPAPVAQPAQSVATPRARGGSRIWPFALAAVVATGVAAVAVLAAMREAPPPSEPLGQTALAPQSAVAAAPASVTSSAATPGAAKKTMQLTLEIQPDYARAYLDGVLLTTSARVQNLPRDGRKYVLRVEAPGFLPHESSFEANGDVRLVIGLNRLPPKRK